MKVKPIVIGKLGKNFVRIVGPVVTQHRRGFSHKGHGMTLNPEHFSDALKFSEALANASDYMKKNGAKIFFK